MNLKPDTIIGKGSECVYLYYYDNDRCLATHEDRKRWECKIGKATGRSNRRIESQVRTERARTPIIAVEVRTDYSYSLESLLHSRMSDQKIGESGSEWFLTNPEEFTNLCQICLDEINSIQDTCEILPDDFMVFVNDLEDWGLAISQLRNELKLSQSDLSSISNVRQGTVSKLENGHDAKLSSIWKILSTLGYSAILVKTNKPNSDG